MAIRITLFLSILLAISSCTVEKQLYSKGLHVEFRKPLQRSDAHYALQQEDEIRENEQEEKILSDSIDPVPSREEKEAKQLTEDEVVPAKTIFPGHAKRKIPYEKLAKRSSSIHIRFEESITHKSVEEKQKKNSVMSKSDIDWQEVGLVGGFWLVVIALIILCVSFPAFALVVEVIFGILALVGIVWLVMLLCGALGNFEWFWSGR